MPHSAKPKQPKKRPPTKPIRQLIKTADRHFSRYVRIRDCEEAESGAWVGPCISCQKPLMVIDATGTWNRNTNIGHYISRGRFVLRFDEENGNLQCVHCNAWRDKESMLTAYTQALDNKYGPGTATKLKQMRNDIHKFTREELEGVIHDSQEALQHYLRK